MNESYSETWLYIEILLINQKHEHLSGLFKNVNNCDTQLSLTINLLRQLKKLRWIFTEPPMRELNNALFFFFFLCFSYMAPSEWNLFNFIAAQLSDILWVKTWNFTYFPYVQLNILLLLIFMMTVKIYWEKPLDDISERKGNLWNYKKNPLLICHINALQ